MERPEKPCVISCGILQKEIERLMESGDIDAEVHFLSENLHMDYSLLDRKKIGLDGLKNVLQEALDRNRRKHTVNREPVA